MVDQVTVLEQNGAVEIYKDKYTGTKMHRPEFDKLMDLLKDGDTLIVTKLDRLGRSAEGIISLIKTLLARNITVKVLNMGTIENNPVGRLIVTFLAGFAEFERDLIVERTMAGRAYKKATDPNYREGRKAKQYDADLFNELQTRVWNGELTAKQAAAALGVGRTKWFEIVKERSA
jgi:DNA invertase Pin-like site-specific DNA recombinase